MEKNIFDLKQSLADLAQFDKAAAKSAKNFGVNFTTQLDALSTVLQEAADAICASFDTSFFQTDAIAAISAANMESGFVSTAMSMSDVFGSTFAWIDEISNNSALLMNELFSGLFAIITTGMQEFQMVGETAFTALSEIAFSSAALISSELITAKEIICGEADALGLEFSEIGLGIETVLETPGREFKTKGENIFSDIGKSFSDKFAAILADLNKLKTNLEPVLSEIQGLFATTAQSMQIVFAAATANININLVNMENQGQQSSSLLSRCYEGFWDVLSKINTMYNAVNNSLKVLNVLEIVSIGVVKTKAAALVATAAAHAVAAAASAVSRIVAAYSWQAKPARNLSVLSPVIAPPSQTMCKFCKEFQQVYIFLFFHR